MSDETVIVDISGDSGPFALYSLSTHTKESPAASHWQASRVRVPRALWEEYERLTARVREIEEEFDAREQALRTTVKAG